MPRPPMPPAVRTGPPSGEEPSTAALRAVPAPPSSTRHRMPPELRGPRRALDLVAFYLVYPVAGVAVAWFLLILLLHG